MPIFIGMFAGFGLQFVLRYTCASDMGEDVKLPGSKMLDGQPQIS